MKRILFFFLIEVLLLGTAFSQNSIYRKYATQNDVKYVSISHTMLAAMSSQKKVRLGNMSLSDMLNYIDNVLIVSSAEPSGMATMISDLAILQTDDSYQTLLVKNVKGERSFSLFRQNNTYDEFVLFSFAETYTIVVITGHFSPEQFQSFFL